MKKMTLIASLAITGMLIANSCGDKFLERPPQGRYDDKALQNSTGVEGLLVGAYGALDGIPVAGDGWFGAVSNWVFGGIASDDAYKGTDAGDQPEQTFIERYVWLPTNNHVRGKWSTLFNGVARTNTVLQFLPQAKDISADRAAQITAEARFLRGVYHFEAKKIWKNIPYYDEVIYNAANPNSVKIPNTEDAWPKIEADFQAAISVLPESQAQPGRATKYAAMAMLAKCYMYQGFDVASGAPNSAKLTAAKALLDQVIASGKYSLTDTYHENFSAGSRNNKESVFEVQYSLTSAADGGGNQGDGLAWPYNNGPGGCCGFYQPAQNLVNAHKTDAATGLPLITTFNDVDVTSDEGVNSNQAFTPYAGTLDSRLDWSVGRRGIPYLDWGIHAGKDWVRDQAYAGPYSPKKHIAEKKYSGVAGWQNLNANNFRMIRYAHILLWAAECEIEVGSLDKARDYINQVRTRAANPAGFVKKDDGSAAANYKVGLYDSFATKEIARDAVRFEERIEFAMEGTRFFDLVRWGVAAETLNKYLEKERLRRSYLNGAQFKKGTHEYYPIPQQEIVNTTVAGKPTLVQNPGY
ncbi:RagB/SusD family nutrient uptake outer membrane protein [Rhodocytophaga rosea]|uniref:RagB/SusD family nutrient uptake outer membrane protein n=1 Tax=Rhodocytophaga rosea TaxID=2704465 RepID=A0A6C0GR02_9BACT|nr:RagB/SusD family nutrient uptake outer membrane protein [Rhodocytophaga rosea]QHT70515.1 RagB/SusD family nutrient uptake outer membrane protein [Rhodocytophaga rosea]